MMQKLLKQVVSNDILILNHCANSFFQNKFRDKGVAVEVVLNDFSFQVKESTLLPLNGFANTLTGVAVNWPEHKC
jgi:hypothetical protein